MTRVLESDYVLVERVVQDVVVAAEERTVFGKLVPPVVQAAACIEVPHHKPVLFRRQLRVVYAPGTYVLDFGFALGVPARTVL